MQATLTQKHEDIIASSGPLLVTGGPGSGKTTLALLKAQANCARLEPGQEILFLSFSRSAVRQIKNRGHDVLKASERKLIRVKTYHLFCLETLVTHGRLLYGHKVTFLYPAQEKLQQAAFRGDWNAERTRLAQEKGLFTFEYLATATAELFERSSAVRNLFANKYPFVIVDEFQDTDNDQWRLIQVFLQKMDVVCLADPEQRIYEYRKGVDSDRIAKFKDGFHPQEFDLGTDNHRNPEGAILRFARAVLNNEPPPPRNSRSRIILAPYAASNFASIVHAGILWTKCKLVNEGIEDPSLAVLCRTNAWVKKVSESISRSNKRRGKVLSPIEHDALVDTELAVAAAQVMGSILEWPAKEYQSAVQDTVRWISQYYRFKNAISTSTTASNETQKYARAADAIANGRSPRPQAVKDLMKLAQKELALSGKFRHHWCQARQILEDIPQLAPLVRSLCQIRNTDFLEEELAKRWLEKGSYRGAPDLIERSFRKRWDEDQGKRGCILMTIHKSKGKEFDGVVLVDGLSGTRSAFFDQPPTDANRRLLFVGITRARSLVTIICPVGAPLLAETMP